MMRAALLFTTLIACSAERAQTVQLPTAVERPVAPVDASLLPPPSPKAPEHACVMLYECGCNSACTEIDQPSASLAAGMKVGVVSGPLRGTTVFVASNRTDDGTALFTVQRADPSEHIIMCGVRGASPLVGYLCANDNFGAARACVRCDP